MILPWRLKFICKEITWTVNDRYECRWFLLHVFFCFSCTNLLLLSSFNFSSSTLIPFHTGVPGSDYINANYVDGYRRQNAYIATQGSLPETFGDFWRMVWEQHTANIIMMTKLEEKSRVRLRRCDDTQHVYFSRKSGIRQRTTGFVA